MAYKDPNDERSKAAKRKHYENNKEAYKARARQREQDMQQYVWEQKRKPCADCKKEYTSWVMQFDHRPDKIKVADIGKMIDRGSWTKLYEEIAKCDVVCANCHIIRTATRANWSLDPRKWGTDKAILNVTEEATVVITEVKEL